MPSMSPMAAGRDAHVAALARCRLLLDIGLEPVLQLSCRDRTALPPGQTAREPMPSAFANLSAWT